MSKGFSLIELMIVVAIIGILAAIATPAYEEYVAKTKVTEALALASSYKGNIIDFYSENDNSKCPTNRATYLNPEAEIFDPSLPAPLQFGNKNIHAMVFGKSLQGKGTCGIWIQFNEDNLPGIARQYILLREDQDAKSVAGQQAIKKTGSAEWICETRIPEKYLPSVCKRRDSVSVSIAYEGSLPHNPLYK